MFLEEKLSNLSRSVMMERRRTGLTGGLGSHGAYGHDVHVNMNTKG